MRHFFPTLFVVAALLCGVTSASADQSPQQQAIEASLLSATNDPDPNVRREALQGLFRSDGGPEIVAAFRKALESSNNTIKNIGLDGLAHFLPDEQRIPLLIASLEDERLSRGAASHLKDVGVASVPHLIKAANKPATRTVALRLLDTILQKEPPAKKQELINLMIAALKDENADNRRLAANVLARALDDIKDQKEVATRPVDARYLRYAEQYLNRYDSNQDGKLSKEELEKMPREYPEADTNNDGLITVEEFARVLMRRTR